MVANAKERVGIVYSIFNKVTGKYYVGQTWCTLKSRWRGHCRNDSDCRLMRRAIHKYGKCSFSLSILTTAFAQQHLDAAEIYWIAHLKCISPDGYNLKSGGSRGLISDETRKKMSASQKLRAPPSDETRKKIAEALRGRRVENRRKPPPTSDHTKKLMSLAKLGKKYPNRKTTPCSEEKKQKIRDAWVKRRQTLKKDIRCWVRRETKGKCEPVIDVSTGVEYTSVSDAHKKLGIPRYAINKSCQGFSNQTRFVWKHVSGRKEL